MMSFRSNCAVGVLCVSAVTERRSHFCSMDPFFVCYPFQVLQILQRPFRSALETGGTFVPPKREESRSRQLLIFHFTVSLYLLSSTDQAKRQMLQKGHGFV